jgi:SAM-dependent methyltransferase
MGDHLETNRRHWDELVGIHQQSAYYDLPGFKAGRDSLHSVEINELGDVHGKTLLHLQCHFGMDTLSWARRGATVTGIDFSEPAIEAAHGLATELGIEAQFVCSDVYSLEDRLDSQFDIVFTSYGVLFWLSDVGRWARVVDHFLRPGGAFYMVEFHPVAGIFENVGVDDLLVRYPYFSGDALRFDDDGTYADREATVTNRTTYSWAHPLGEVVSALIDVGLHIEFLHEFPFTVEQWYPFMEKSDDGYWRLKERDKSVPLLYSIRATKPV